MEHHQSMHHHHHHNLQNTQGHHHAIHWNYSSPTTNISSTTPLTSTPIGNTSSNNQTWTPPSIRGIKRAMSESDCDDIYSEESSKEHPSSIENDSCQLMSRKKRRGVIEKKRRDRINSSLSELKRLVPSAFEKQGSAKLEKAEILQLTVDHLKMLHAKGIDSMAFDPQRFAMDYHIIGFRECASEVARYLVTIEGMDIQDPLRLRLMSHLQCFVAQRELSAKSSATTMSSSNWSSLQNSYQPNYTAQSYQVYPTTTPITPSSQLQNNNNQQHNSFNSSSSSSYMSTTTSSYLGSSLIPQSPEYSSSSGYATATNNTSSSSNVNTSSGSNNATSTSPAPVASSNDPAQQQDNQQPIYTDLSNSNDRLQLNLSGNYHYGNVNQLYANTGNNGYNNNNNNNSKPYRPWHPEMAY